MIEADLRSAAERESETVVRSSERLDRSFAVLSTVLRFIENRFEMSSSLDWLSITGAAVLRPLADLDILCTSFQNSQERDCKKGRSHQLTLFMLIAVDDKVCVLRTYISFWYSS